MKISVPFFYFAAIIDSNFADGKHLKAVAKQDILTLEVKTYSPKDEVTAYRFAFEKRKNTPRTPDALIFNINNKTYTNHQAGFDRTRVAIEDFPLAEKPPITLHDFQLALACQHQRIVQNATINGAIPPPTYLGTLYFSEVFCGLQPYDMTWQGEQIFQASEVENVILATPGRSNLLAAELSTTRKAQINAIETRLSEMLIPESAGADILHQIPSKLYYEVRAMHDRAHITATPVFSDDFNRPEHYDAKYILEFPGAMSVAPEDLDSVIAQLRREYRKNAKVSVPDNLEECLFINPKQVLRPSPDPKVKLLC